MNTKISAKSSAAKRHKDRRSTGKKVRDFLETNTNRNRHETPHIRHRSGRSLVIYNTYTLYPHTLPDIISYTGMGKRPKWNDIDLRTQQYLMTNAMAKERCLSFTANLHPDFESKVLLTGERIQDVFVERFTKKLKAIGFPNLLYHFVFEAADKKRQPCKVHVHGTARITSDEAWEALELALAYASGNNGKRRAAGAVKTKGYRNGGWLRYCLKNEHVDDPRLPGRRVHFSSAAREAGQDLLTLITGDRTPVHMTVPPKGAAAVVLPPRANDDPADDLSWGELERRLAAI